MFTLTPLTTHMGSNSKPIDKPIATQHIHIFWSSTNKPVKGKYNLFNHSEMTQLVDMCNVCQLVYILIPYLLDVKYLLWENYYICKWELWCASRVDVGWSGLVLVTQYLHVVPGYAFWNKPREKQTYLVSCILTWTSKHKYQNKSIIF